jgi:polyisoprenoid-binding protein YceI
LEIQGVKKPFKSDISLVTDGKTRKVKAQGTVKLSDYGIEQPQQLGVKVSNEVAIKADLVLE